MNLSWIEISKKALLNNIFVIKKRLKPKTKFMAVVKANAYGHGLLEVAKTIKSKVDYFAVYNFLDAVLLRQNKISKPILVLGRSFANQIPLALKHDIEITISTIDLLKAAKKISGKKKLIIHLCIDSGMGRDGFVFSDIKKVLPLLKNKNIEVKGLYSHFASADQRSFDSYSKKQVAELLKWKKELNEIGLNPIIHISASAGVFIKDFECQFDLVRVGLSLYGLWVSPEVRQLNEKETELLPVLSWKTKISEIKFLPKGSSISYGCTHILKRDSKIAILPIGYFDGVSRVSSNKGFVIVNGIKVPQLGRVTMNIIIVDVTDVKEVKEGDLATVIGCDKNEKILADDWANWSQTSNYEVVTRLNPALKRVVI